MVGLAGVAVGLLYVLQEKLVSLARAWQQLAERGAEGGAGSRAGRPLQSAPPQPRAAGRLPAQIYVPRLPGIPSNYPYCPDDFGLAYEDVWITAADGTQLHAWLIWWGEWTPEERRSRPTVLFFQARACTFACRAWLSGITWARARPPLWAPGKAELALALARQGAGRPALPRPPCADGREASLLLPACRRMRATWPSGCPTSSPSLRGPAAPS